MKKTFKVILSIIIIMTFAFTSLGASIAVKSITPDSSKITLCVGKTYTLKVTFTPSDATNKKLTFSSNNKNIATVDKNGKIKGIKAGKTVITATSSSNRKASVKCNVTVLQKEVTLKYITWMTKGEDKPMMEAFMKVNPGIKVMDEALDGIQYDKLLKTRILSGDAPDVFLVQWAQYSKYVNEGYLMNITNEPGMDLQKKSPSVDSLYDVKGKKYGFMISGNGGPIPVYYNKKYFAKLNLTPPKTMDEFFAVCEAIKADGIDPIVSGNKDRWPLEFFFRHRGYSGMLDKYPEWGFALYNGDVKPSEFFKKELELTEVLVNKGYIGKASLTLTWPQSVPYFVDGKAGMLPQGPWVPSLPEIKDADPAKFELGCFTSPLEATNGKKYTTGEADRTLVVSATTKNPNEAKKLFNFFIAPENLRPYLEANTITTFINLDYKVDPVLQEHVKNLSSPEYVLVLKQKANITPAFADATWNAYQNIQAGSTAEKEALKLDIEFEKTKSQMVVN